MLKRISIKSPASMNRVLGGLAALLLAASCVSAESGADSPEALLAAAQKAAADRDGAALVRLVAPSQLLSLAAETDMAADFIGAFSEDDEAAALTAALVKLRDEYGVNEDVDLPPLEVDPDTTPEEVEARMAARAKMTYADVDLVGYVGELTALLMSMPAMEGQSPIPAGDIGDVRVDGDRVSALVGAQEIELLREDGRWYLAGF